MRQFLFLFGEKIKNMKFKKGDIVISEQKVEREIVKVCKGHYLWKYPKLAYGVYDSRDSNDPLLDWWKLKQ